MGSTFWRRTGSLDPLGVVADRLVLYRYLPHLIQQCNQWLKESVEANG